MGTAETVAYALESFPIETSAEKTARILADFKERFGGTWAEAPVVADPDEVAPNGAAHEGWELLGLRGQVAKILQARGHEKKGNRFANCNRFGRPGVCSRYPDEHKFFQRHGCGMPFCSNCAQEERRRLFEKYFAVLLFVLTHHIQIIPKAWILGRITFTLRSDGSVITPEKVKLFNSAVRKVMKSAVQIVGGDDRYGMLFVDEVGSESNGLRCERVGNGLNLHCHGLYLGSRLDWKKTRDLWVATTMEMFGASSYGFRIDAIRGFVKDPMSAVRFGLSCLLKYASKPPAVSPKRLADLICAFHGTRRVHALGMFYGVSAKSDKGDVSCPRCHKFGIPSTISFEGRRFQNGSCIPRLVLVGQLEAAGYCELSTVRRELFFSREDAAP